MCGIIAAIKKEPGKGLSAADMVKRQLQDQLSRGKEGFGTVIVGKDMKVKVLRATELTEALLQLRFDVPKDAKAVFFHHRYPTSTDNRLSQTHPMLVANGKLEFEWYVMHNGVISNDDELQEIHEKEGIEYRTLEAHSYGTSTYQRFNDSEAIAVDTALWLENRIKDIRAEGAAAIIALKVEKGTKLLKGVYMMRNTNPLNAKREKGGLLIASEADGTPITADLVYELDVENLKLVEGEKIMLRRYPATAPAQAGFNLAGPKSDGKAGAALPAGVSVTEAEDAEYEDEFAPDVEIIESEIEAFCTQLYDDEETLTMDHHATIARTLEEISDRLHAIYQTAHKRATGNQDEYERSKALRVESGWCDDCGRQTANCACEALEAAKEPLKPEQGGKNGKKGKKEKEQVTAGAGWRHE